METTPTSPGIPFIFLRGAPASRVVRATSTYPSVPKDCRRIPYAILLDPNPSDELGSWKRSVRISALSTCIHTRSIPCLSHAGQSKSISQPSALPSSCPPASRPCRCAPTSLPPRHPQTHPVVNGGSQRASMDIRRQSSTPVVILRRNDEGSVPLPLSRTAGTSNGGSSMGPLPRFRKDLPLCQSVDAAATDVGAGIARFPAAVGRDPPGRVATAPPHRTLSSCPCS